MGTCLLGGMELSMYLLSRGGRPKIDPVLELEYQIPSKGEVLSLAHGATDSGGTCKSQSKWTLGHWGWIL